MRISNRFVYVYIYIFFHSLIFVKAGIIYNISKVKCILEKTYSLLKISGKKKKKKRNRDDECAFNKGNCLHTRLRVII